MTSPSGICFKTLWFALLLGLLRPLPAATVAGSIQLINSTASNTRKSQDLSGVVVWLVPETTSAIHPSNKHTQMIQKDKRFTPHILAVATGTTVDFPNLDPIFHNAFSNYDGEIFDVALYPPGTSRSVRFDKPGIVRVFCNIHPSMSAIIVVLNYDHFAATDRDGRFVLPDVPAGTYELHFFHERATSETLDKLTRNLTVQEDDIRSPEVSISEAGYLPVAHKNKYGHDYPPAADDDSPYNRLPVR